MKKKSKRRMNIVDFLYLVVFGLHTLRFIEQKIINICEQHLVVNSNKIHQKQIHNETKGQDEESIETNLFWVQIDLRPRKRAILLSTISEFLQSIQKSYKKLALRNSSLSLSLTDNHTRKQEKA
jgi:hypothetical protein